MRIKFILDSEMLQFRGTAEVFALQRKVYQKFLTMRANYQTIVTVLEN